MSKIFLGTDCGATTTKTTGIYSSGDIISKELRQVPTNSINGRAAVIEAWLNGAEDFLLNNSLSWQDVAGVGLALPGPFKAYGVMAGSANFSKEFENWNFYEDYQAALNKVSNRNIPLVVGNDGDLGGVGEAFFYQKKNKSSVLFIAAGSGLGAAYIDKNGQALTGDHFSGMEGGHMPLPLQCLGERFTKVKPFSCGCGLSWGCVEAYTTISGLRQYLDHFREDFPEHEIYKKEITHKEILSLRSMAQNDDPLALTIFDTQAKALGIHSANLVKALDVSLVIIAGGLIDPESTTSSFRARYLSHIKENMEPYLFENQKSKIEIFAAQLGELAQAIGAAINVKNQILLDN